MQQQSAAIQQTASSVEAIAAVAQQSAGDAQQLSANSQQQYASNQQVATAAQQLQTLTIDLEKLAGKSSMSNTVDGIVKNTTAAMTKPPKTENKPATSDNTDNTEVSTLVEHSEDSNNTNEVKSSPDVSGEKAK